MRFIVLPLILLLPAVAWPQGIFAPPGDLLSIESGLVAGGGGKASYRDASFAAGVPLGKAGGWTFGTGLNAAHLRSFDDRRFPGELYRVGAEVTARNGRAGFAMGARSNSDRPFGEPDTADLSADLSWAISTGTHRFLAGLNFSTQRSFWRGIPIPYLLYSYMSENVQFALPFFIRVRLRPMWWLTAAYIPIENGRVSVRYEPSRGDFTEVEVYSRLDQYLLYGRSGKERGLYQSWSAAALRRGFTLGGGFSAEAEAGYAFSNHYFNGEEYNDVNNRVSLGPRPFAGLRVKYVPGKNAAPAVDLQPRSNGSPPAEQ